ncbi:MAG: hypothetical protein HDT40_02505 [Lachnospiraceae bacterium]|nr:hypothetical protein [Lachnospiraceae bacterium]
MKKNTFKKRIIATMMAMFMAVSMVCIKADAKSVGTGTISTVAAGYTLHVRESGNTTELGVMYMHKNSKGVYNKFTASKKCGETTVRVSNVDAWYATSTIAELQSGKYVEISKEATNPTKVYGSCTVNY